MTASKNPPGEPVVILVAEDNKYDRMILKQAFDDVGLNATLSFVSNGEEVLDYLHRRKAYSDQALSPRPAMILMDLNMPRMNGQETLKAIRADETLRMLPVVVLSTSDNPAQIAQAYVNGGNAFMTKPGPYDDFIKLINAFGDYWLVNARLPKVLA